jgi:TolB-like protein/DNA-binding winged helix-turn-helix (wHTH) protein/Tfp pilus assembly protein PilF
MAARSNKLYLLGEFALEPDKRSLMRGGQSVHLTAGPFQVLVYLIENRDRVVSRNELLDRFWDGKDVYGDSLRKSVGAIRKALLDGSENPRFIETHYGEGYRYIGPVEERFVHSEASNETEKAQHVTIPRASVSLSEQSAVPNRPASNERPDQPAAPTPPTPQPAALIAPQSRRRTAIQASIVVLIIVAGLLLIASSKRREVQGNLTPIHSIAVLPFKNMSGNQADEYFSDGLTEDFITELAKVKGLKVVSRNSVFTFKGKDIDPRDVGKKLGVAAILEGSVEESADRVRVQVRLVSSSDGSVIWAGDSRERTLKDVFVIQDSIACSVVSELKVKICGDGERFKGHTENVEAYQSYLKGRYLLNNQYQDINQSGPESLKRAAEYFEDAVQIDPNYAPAYAGIADAYTGLVWFSPDQPQPLIDKARAAAMEAVAIDDELPEAQTALGTVYIHQWDFDAARQAYERAIALSPDNAWAHDGYATYLMAEGRIDEMLAEIKRAEELDPLNAYILSDKGALLYMGRRYDESIAEFLKRDELHQYAGPDENVAGSYLGKGMYAEAIKEMQVVNDATTSGARAPEVVASLAVAYAAAGRREEARRLLDEVTRMSNKQYVPKTFFAYIYSMLGDKDRAFEMLENAYREHDSTLIGLKTHPWLDPLREDPRFADLIRRVGLSSV